MQGWDGQRCLKAVNHGRRQPLEKRTDRENGCEQNHGNLCLLVFLTQAGEHPIASAPERFLVEHKQIGRGPPELVQAIESIRGCTNTIACVREVGPIESGRRDVSLGDQQALFHGTPYCGSQ